MNNFGQTLFFVLLFSLSPSVLTAQPLSVSCDVMAQHRWDDMEAFHEYLPATSGVKINGDLREGIINVSGLHRGVWDGQWVVSERISSDISPEELFVLKRLELQRTLAEYKRMTLTSDYRLGSAYWAGLTGVIAISLHCKPSL